MTSTTRLLARLQALLAALRDGPLAWPELLPRLGAAYPSPASARRMVARDIAHLAQLGITIERSATRPPVYRLCGGAPQFSGDELRTLVLIRESFGPHHPQAAQVQALVRRLTEPLGEADQRALRRRPARRVTLQPAIDYTPYAALFDTLEAAIDRKQTLTFRYQPTHKAAPTLHREVEPYDIEFYERHFYLVGFSHNSGHVHEFRVDRIDAASLATVPGGSWSQPRRPTVIFRYRLAAALASAAISQRFEQQREVERLPNGDVVVEARARSDFAVIRTLLRYADRAELLEPAHLREKMAEQVRALAQVYGIAPSEG